MSKQPVPLTPKQIQRIESICENSVNYLRIHAKEAVRINPAIKGAIDGLIFRKIDNLRRSLTNKFSFGGVSRVIADIILSEDEERKAILMNPKDERSLFFQIVASDDMNEAPDKKSHIFDLHSYFERLDPQLGRFSELVIHWVWWDLYDAVDSVIFEQAAQRFNALKGATLTDQVIEAYRKTMHATPKQEIGREDILRFEISHCDAVMARWTQRRETEGAYQKLLDYEPATGDEGPTEEADQLIMQIASHLTGISKISESEDVSPNALAYYAERMNASTKDIDRYRIIQFERQEVAALKKQLQDQMCRCDEQREVPYDYKIRQMEKFDQALAAMKKIVPPPESEETE